MLEINFDIEAIPQQPEAETRAAIAVDVKPPGSITKAETIAEWMGGTGKYVGVRDAEIDERYRKTALDGGKGSICSLAWSYGDSEEVHNLLAHPGGYSEAEILAGFFMDVKDNLRGNITAFFVGHYIGTFDLRFLFQRAVVNMVNPGFWIPYDGRHGKDFFDTRIAWTGNYHDHISLDALCIALGIPGKDGMDGSMVWDYYKQGRYPEIGVYNQDDVRRVKGAKRRLSFRV
jgi:3'-5' exonuclease